MVKITNTSLKDVPDTNNQLGLYHCQEVNFGQENNTLLCLFL